MEATMSDVQVKKVFAEVFALLSAEENQNKKVKTILSEVSVLMSKSTNAVAETTRYDEDGNLTHVYCYYHKEWEDITECEYGAKKNTKSGLNTMCKLGVSNWTKQQRAKKKAESELLTKLSTKEIEVDDLPTLQAEILEASKVIVAR
jgi:hypothetical protein